MAPRNLTVDRVLVKDRYELMRKIGSGTTGSVYSAFDHELQREVAIKVLHKDYASNQEIINRFEAETLITSRLQHPGVVAVFDRATVPGGGMCYIMSLALGKTLGDYLDEMRNQDDPWREASLVDRINIFIKILDVITYAHGQGVVHRDLKPENIILGEHGEVRVLDWGLARVLHEPESPLPPEEFYDEYFGDQRGRDDSTRVTAHEHSDSFSDTDRVSQHGHGGYSNRLAAEDATIISAALSAQSGAQGAAANTPPEPADTSTDDTVSVAPEPEFPGARPGGVPATDGLSATVLSGNSGNSDTAGSQDPEDEQATQKASHLTTGGHEGETRVTQAHRRRSNSSSARRRTVESDRRRSQVRSSNNERSTRVGAVLGSPAYMSPEQAAGDASSADERTDVYSLGVILYELLTLSVPVQRHSGEAIVQYIKRVEEGDRVPLAEAWPDGPQQLQVITEWALAKDPQERYASCEIFREELRILLVQFSENFAERERQRLANERKAAWLGIGSWNYQTQTQLDPFTEPVLSFEGEPVGQVAHPEMEGVLIGGVGLQVYPVAREMADDIHVRLAFSVSRGHEAVVFVRGVPPHPCYSIAIGAFAGRWLTMSRMEGSEGKQRPILLSMVPLPAGILDDDTTRHILDIQVIGASIIVEFDNWSRIELRDPCPLAGPMHRQMAIGSRNSQVVIHQLQIEQRRSPLMIPSFMVANELLRQKLIPQAIDLYRRFLEEHAGSDEAIEAHFMLCLAFRQAGHLRQSERELEVFLSQAIDHPLAQDAIFELARIKVADGNSVERAVRTVLSYQEADDRSRSRFCLWMIDMFSGKIAVHGLTPEIEQNIGYLQHLISLFADSELLMDTLAMALNVPVAEFGRRLLDRGEYDALESLLDAVQRCRLRGFDIQATGLHPLQWYQPLVKRMQELPRNHPDFVARVDRLLGNANGLSDILFLLSLGARDPLLRWLEAQGDLSPTFRLLRASLAKQLGRDDIAQRDFMLCFQMMDVLETERTSHDTTVAARLAFFALDYLPWEVVWEPIKRLVGGERFRALAALMAEQLGHPMESAEAYRSLTTVGSGYVEYARAGLQRLGLDDVED